MASSPLQPPRTRTRSRTRTAVEAQPVCQRLARLTISLIVTFPSASLPLALPGEVSTDAVAPSKSAVCHAQVKADPVKLFTCMLKT